MDIEKHFNDITSEEDSVVTKENKTIKRDHTKYSLNGSAFMTKSDFVPTLVRYYVNKHPELTYKQLKTIFNDSLCAPSFKFIGFLCTEAEYAEWDSSYKEKRYQPNKPNRRLVSGDNVIFFVNTQWTLDSMRKIVNLATEEGWKVETKI